MRPKKNWASLLAVKIVVSEKVAKKKVVTMQLDEDLLDILQKAAESKGIARQTLVNAILKQVLLSDMTIVVD